MSFSVGPAVADCGLGNRGGAAQLYVMCACLANWPAPEIAGLTDISARTTEWQRRSGEEDWIVICHRQQRWATPRRNYSHADRRPRQETRPMRGQTGAVLNAEGFHALLSVDAPGFQQAYAHNSRWS